MEAIRAQTGLRKVPLALAALLLLAAIPLSQPWARTMAQSGGSYDLSWWTADGGGSASAGGAHVLGGTAGQPDGGVLSGGDYVLGGGFWAGGGMPLPGSLALYLPMVARDAP